MTNGMWRMRRRGWPQLVVVRAGHPSTGPRTGPGGPCPRQIIGIEGPEQRVPGHAQVEGVDEVDEELIPGDPVKECVHSIDGRRSRLLLGYAAVVQW